MEKIKKNKFQDIDLQKIYADYLNLYISNLAPSIISRKMEKEIESRIGPVKMFCFCVYLRNKAEMEKARNIMLNLVNVNDLKELEEMPECNERTEAMNVIKLNKLRG